MPYSCWLLHRIFYVKSVKSILVQALRLCTGRTAHRGSRGIALLFLDHGTRRGWGVSVTPRPHFTPEKDPAPIVQEAGWAPGPVWTGAENLTHTGIRSPDRPARSQSLYRLRYSAHIFWVVGNNLLAGHTVAIFRVKPWSLTLKTEAEFSCVLTQNTEFPTSCRARSIPVKAIGC